jgi:hypothetical protein
MHSPTIGQQYPPPLANSAVRNVRLEIEMDDTRCRFQLRALLHHQNVSGLVCTLREFELQMTILENSVTRNIFGQSSGCCVTRSRSHASLNRDSIDRHELSTLLSIRVISGER